MNKRATFFTLIAIVFGLLIISVIRATTQDIKTTHTYSQSINYLGHGYYEITVDIPDNECYLFNSNDSTLHFVDFGHCNQMIDLDGDL